MLSLSHGSFLGFDFLGLRGAGAFKISEQAVLNRLRCCSASKSGKNESRDRDKHTLLKVFVKSSQKLEEKERVSCTVGVILELSWEKGNVNNTGIWSESRVSKTWASVIEKLWERTKSKVCPCVCVGSFTHWTILNESMRLRNSISRGLDWQHTCILKSPSRRILFTLLCNHP